MKILLTSGGTKIPVDRVRDITNMSNGTFGSRIAHVALESGGRVFFLHAKHSCTPFSCTFDFANGFFKNLAEFLRMSIFGLKHHRRYESAEFRNFDDYEIGLQKAIKEFRPDVIILAAAVSDYGVKNYIDGKLRTSEDQSIDLYPLEKIIGKVKGWAPYAALVGFKLLIEDDDAVVEAAKTSILNNGCSIVVANTLQSLESGNHTLHIVERPSMVTTGMVRCMSSDFSVSTYRKHAHPNDRYYLARMVMRAVKRIYR